MLASSSQKRSDFKVIALMMLFTTSWMVNVVDAFAYRQAIVNVNKKPIVGQRFSVETNVRNGSIIQQDVINRVHHQHEQTIGNIHVLTNIHISNVITVLNATTLRPAIDAKAKSGEDKTKINNHFL